MSDLTFQELKERIDNNDNRFTAKPYLLLLREKRKYVAHDEYNHDSEEVYVDLTGDYYQTKTLEEMVQFYKESVGGEEEFNENYPDGLIVDKHYSIHQMGSYQDTVNVFLTDKGYQDHMELNRHNVGEHDTFGIHAFRNPEISKMFEAIERVVELEDQLAKKDEIIKKLKRYAVHNELCDIFYFREGVCSCGFSEAKKIVEGVENEQIQENNAI